MEIIYKIGLVVLKTGRWSRSVWDADGVGGGGGADGKLSVVTLWLLWVVVVDISGSLSDIKAVSIARSTSQSCAVKYWRHVSTESICVNS